jgi:membrane fusion protein, multidrug efflux system
LDSLPAARRWKDRLQAQRRPLILVGVAGLLALVGGGWLAGHWGVEETDNAQLQTHLVEISSRLPGTIQAVPVQDNQAVQAGQLLVLLDPRDARAAWVRAQADLLEARQQASAMRSQTQSSASDAAAAEDQATGDRLMARAELDRAGAELRRLEFLLRQGGAARQDVERARATYRKAQGPVSRSEASALLATASARKVTVEQQKAAAAAARVHQAEAALQEAALRLSYTRIQAPSAGRIGSRSAEPGRQVQPGQPLMTVVAPHPWVEANFKETQLDALRPGQPAEVGIDAFPGRRLHGHVVSVAPASGARFALLPPDNATGNFTKVVQRVTVRIALDDVPPALAPRLLPGLSATVRVRRP